MAVETIELDEQIRREPSRERLTFEEFLEWCDGTGAEWVDGKVIMASPASVPHQQIGGLLEILMRIYVETRGLGVVLRAPFAMRLGELRRSREPDLIFLAKKRMNLLTHNYLDGAAELVVETFHRKAWDEIAAKKLSNTNEQAFENTGCSILNDRQRNSMNSALTSGIIRRN